MARRDEIFGFDKNLVMLGALGLGAFLLFGRQITQAVIGGAASVVKDVATGAVIGVGEAVGIPETDAARCEAALAAGDYWEASFYCPAGKFLKASTGAVYNAAGELLGVSTPGPPQIISVEWTAQIPGEFGEPGQFWYEPLPGAIPFEGAPNISDYPAA